MASPTKKTKVIRRNRNKNKGTKRKAKDRNHGTTRTPAELFGEE